MSRIHFDRRDFLRTSAAVGMTAALPGWLAAAQPQSGRKPNIVLMMADDLGYECIGANGSRSYSTPNLDHLAESGARFNHCYSQPLCTPSRVQIMTGLYNVRNYTDFGELDRSQTTFAHLLKDRGYATCIAGKWQLGEQPDAPHHFGFDQACLWQHTRNRTDKNKRDTRYPNPHLDINGQPHDFDNGEYGPDVCTRFIGEFMEKNRDRPFFVYYPMILTHCPFAPTPDSEDWNPNSKGKGRYKGNPKYFGDMVTYMDKLVGEIVAKLEALGLRDDTLVIFIGDNGTDKPIVSQLDGREVAGAKGKMTDAGTRVPLIANWPHVIPQGTVSDDLIDFSDFLPTFCDATGDVPKDRLLDGRSFLPQLRGEPGDPRNWVYCWYSARRGDKPQAWARNQRYKLYADGSFYDVPNDWHEKNPLTDPSPEAKQARDMLQQVLDRYSD